jgi:ubiquinol-cytochrome c reductase cytochrome b subunit
MILWRQKHAQFAGLRRTEENVVGSPMFPQYTAKTIALFMGVAAMCCALGAFVQINPIWLWGPYQTWRAISPAQPDWYIGWLEGALRISPHWAIHFPGHMIPSAFWPGIVLPFGLMLVLLVYPFAEAKIRNDAKEHNLLDRPRDVPVRTALGTGVFIFMLGLFLAGSDDVQARYLHLPVQDMVLGYRLFCVFGPLIGFWIAYSIAAGLKTRGGAHEAERVRLKRTPEGGYEEEPIG